MRLRFLIGFIFLLAKSYAKASPVYYWDSCATEEVIITSHSAFNHKCPSPIIKRIKQIQINTRKLTAAILAFPFPFGIVGLHRIYLGTKPYVPVVYIATLGGVFGVLPLIDFFAIIFDKDFDTYNENGKVLMWVK